MFNRLALLSLVLFSSASFAINNPVTDEKNVLLQVDSFLGHSGFESLLTCGKKAQFSTPLKKAELGCDDSGCWSLFESMDMAESAAEVANCSADAVSIYFDNGKIWDISKADYDSAQGNLARLFLTQVSNFIDNEGSVKVTGAAAAKITLVSGQVVEGMNIQAQFYLPGHTEHFYPMIISVMKTDNGAAQVVRFRFDSQTVIRLKGI